MVECLSRPFIRLKSPSASFANIYSLLATRYFYSKTIFHVWVACSNNSKAVFLWFFSTNYAIRLWPFNTFNTTQLLKATAQNLARRTAMFYLALAAKWRQNAAPVNGSGYSHEKTWSRARADRMPLCCRRLDFRWFHFWPCSKCSIRLIQNIFHRFPGWLIVGIAEPLDLILHFAFSFTFLENSFNSKNWLIINNDLIIIQLLIWALESFLWMWWRTCIVLLSSDIRIVITAAWLANSERVSRNVCLI